MLLGYGRHGKDASAEYLAQRYGFRHVSSSMFVGKKAVFVEASNLKSELARKYNVPIYPTFEACFNDRHNHRAFWFEAISAYNAEDPARLGKELFQEYDMYVGLRSLREFEALKAANAFDHAIWIDASQRLPPEPASSMTITPDLADAWIDNNRTLQELHKAIDWVMKMMDVQLLENVDSQRLAV